MPRNGPFRRSRIGSLARLAQLMPIFPSNYGTNLSLKSRTPSIFSIAHKFILTAQLTKPLKGRMTGTATQWLPPAPRPSSMKIPTLVPCGRPMALTLGSSARLWTTTDAICTMSPKPVAIPSLVQPASFPSIALHHLPNLHKTHNQEMLAKLQESLKNVAQQEQTLTVLHTLAQHLDAFVSGNHLPTPTTTQVSIPPEEQKVTPIRSPQPPPLQRVTAAPVTLLANNPTTPCILRAKPHAHQHKTRANTPHASPLINCAHHVPLLPLFTEVIEPTPPPAALPATTATPR